MRYATGLLAAVLGVTACAEAGTGEGDDVQDIDGDVEVDADPDRPDMRPPIDAMIDGPPAPVAVTLSHSTDATTILAGNSAACSNSQTSVTRENSYYRKFVLAQHGVSGQFTAQRVDFGIESANAPSSSQTVQVRLYLLNGAFQTSNLTLAYGQNVTVANQDLTLMSVTLTSPVVIPAGATLVAEVFVPDGEAAGNIFFIGSNMGGETDESYVRAPTCNINQPQTFESLAFPNTHVVLTVSGTTP